MMEGSEVGEHNQESGRSGAVVLKTLQRFSLLGISVPLRPVAWPGAVMDPTENGTSSCEKE